MSDVSSARSVHWRRHCISSLTSLVRLRALARMPLQGPILVRSTERRALPGADICAGAAERLELVAGCRKPNAASWDFAAVHQRRVERQILPRADTQRLPDRHRRTTGIGPASDCQDPTDLTRETVIRSAGLPRQKDPLPNTQGRGCRFRILPFVHNDREVAPPAQTDENDAWNALHRTRPTQARKTPAIAEEPHQPGQTHHAFRASRRTATHPN